MGRPGTDCHPDRKPIACHTKCRLTTRSRRAPTAGHQARPQGTVYILLWPGLASPRRCRLSSNVRPHRTPSVALTCIALLALTGGSVVACVSLAVLALSPNSAVLQQALSKRSPSWLTSGAWRAPRHFLSSFGKAVQTTLHAALAVMLLALLVGGLLAFRGDLPPLGSCISVELFATTSCPLLPSSNAANIAQTASCTVSTRREA